MKEAHVPTQNGSPIMQRISAVLAGSCLVVAGFAASAAEPRGFSADDLVRLTRLSAPQFSPSGDEILYAVRTTDMSANKGVNSLWRMPFDGGTATRVTAIDQPSGDGAWSADGQSILFVSSKSGSSQLWRQPMVGGAAVQITDLPVDVAGFKLSPDGRQIALALEVFDDCADLVCSKGRLDERGKALTSGVLFDQLFVRHWDTVKDGRLSQLFVATLDDDGKVSGMPVRVSKGVVGNVPSKPFGDASEFAFSPDGKWLAFAARRADREEAWSTNLDLYLVPADGSVAPKNLTASNKALDTAPVFSPDGRTLYYTAMRRPGFEADRLAVMAMDLETGASREIAKDWDRSAGGLQVSSDGKTLYATANDVGHNSLFAIDIASGKVRELIDGGYVSSYTVHDGRIVAAVDDLGAPAELFATTDRGGKLRRLTASNTEALGDVRFGEFEQFEFRGAGGDEVHGYVVKPWNYVEGQKYPVAFLIHGGPQGSFGDHFHYRWNPQTYAGAGYAAVMIDFHGSTGYGQDFTDSISGDWGGKPLEDLKAGWKAALDRYAFLDGDRACALGASYGGYMINWIAGQWQDAFKCLVNHDGVFDNRSMYYSTEELWFPEWEHGGPYYASAAGYEKHNPVNHVAEWRVPMLVIHGALDHRVPLEQGLSAFTALQRKGIPSQFLYFPDENHWVLKPANSVLWHETVMAWLDRWTSPAHAGGGAN